MGMDGMNSPGGLLGMMVTRVTPALIPWFSVSRIFPSEDVAPWKVMPHSYKVLALSWLLSMSLASHSNSLSGQHLLVGMVSDK